MRALQWKEWRLSMSPVPLLFLLLSGLILIPNYPYYVTFFYNGLGIFMLMQSLRENRDTAYLMLLPVTKVEMVRARFRTVVQLELLQALACVPFMALRASYGHLNNAVGIEANTAFLGLGLRDPEAFSALARALFTCAAALHDSFGLQVSYCCLGGGLPVAHRRTERDADIAAISRGVQAEFSRIMEPAGLGGVPVETGLGRWLTAHAGILLTTVTGVKRGAQDWLGVDVSRADLLRPELYGTYHHISVLGDDRVEGRRRYAVGDRIPEPREPFGQRLLPECRRGARLVIHDVGAYGASMGYSYGLTPHCAEYLYQADGTLRCIRRAQREDELFSTLDENPDFTAPAETPSGQAESQRPSEG